MKLGIRLAETTKGRLIKIVMMPMLSTDPNPNNRMYTIPAKAESMDARINNVNAALPATP